MRGLPQQLAGLSVVDADVAEVLAKKYVVVGDHRRRVSRGECLELAGVVLVPALFARLAVEANQLLAAVEVDAVGVDGKREPADGRLELPKPVARLGVDGRDVKAKRKIFKLFI